MDAIIRINGIINGFVWGPIMLILLVGTGVYITFLTNFFQFSKFGLTMRETIGKILTGKREKSKAGTVTPFQAMTTALASTVGVGNVAGVATAIASGGPGAVFWMWVSALFGMMTKYGEILLAVKYRETDENGVHYGGPMYYIEKGLKMKWLAVLFAIFGTLACFGIGNMNQANEIASAINKITGLSPLIGGILVAIFVALVIIGGITRIGKVTELVVPFMAIFYIVGGIAALIMNASHLPDAFAQIFAGAFSTRAVGGGIMGYAITRAMRYGFARGVFSNEAGLGSAPIAHSAADTDNPVKQAMWGIFEVFVDTIIICSLTALVIVTSGLVTVNEGVVSAPASGGALTSMAYSQVFGSFGGTFVSIAIIFFAASTILGWSYYGQQCLGYLTKNNKSVILTYRLIFICFIIVGALGELSVLWDISDTLNGMMAIPNLIGVIGLSGVIVKTTRDYLRDPDSVAIKNN